MNLSFTMDYWIDSHAHIYADQFNEDRHDALIRSQLQGVGKIVMPNVDHTSIDAMMETESRAHGQCYATMGLHPCSVTKDFQKELYLVEDWLNKRTFAAIGEMGTDLYWDKSFWNEQKEAFEIQVGWAKKFNLPIIIHCRETLDQTIEIVERLQDGKLTGVFHCFTGNATQAKKISELKFYVGIGGVATFKKGGLDVVLPDIPMESIILETDSPYLAPVPHRGKRNEPSFIPLIAEKVAEVKKVSVTALQEQTTKNALQLFKHIH